MEILAIGVKINIDNGKIKVEKVKNSIKITYLGKTYETSKYNITRDYTYEFEIKSNKIYFSSGEIYLYNFNEIYNVDKIFSKAGLIFIGLNLSEEKVFSIKENSVYLLSKTSKIMVGGGKIETDFGSKLVNEKELAKDILLISDGILIRGDII